MHLPRYPDFAAGRDLGQSQAKGKVEWNGQSIFDYGQVDLALAKLEGKFPHDLTNSFPLPTSCLEEI
jgi:hypothetical protein